MGYCASQATAAPALPMGKAPLPRSESANPLRGDLRRSTASLACAGLCDTSHDMDVDNGEADRRSDPSEAATAGQVTPTLSPMLGPASAVTLPSAASLPVNADASVELARFDQYYGGDLSPPSSPRVAAAPREWSLSSHISAKMPDADDDDSSRSSSVMTS